MKINKLEGAAIEVELANEDERNKVIDYFKAKGYRIEPRWEKPKDLPFIMLYNIPDEKLKGLDYIRI